ncbi:hypothetical protein AAVH_30214 [Aphelenchoides avenae]|nr:hypothetical protein AAVH_30214 [Aphelenchus avenae]
MAILVGGSIPYEHGNQASLAVAYRQLAEVIGAHAVTTLTFHDDLWNHPDIGTVFEAAPALKYAEDVVLHSPHGSTTGDHSEAFMHNFAGLKALCLHLDYHVFCQIRWTFLRWEVQTESFDRCVEELVGYCATLPHPLGGESLELDFSESYFSGAFCLRIIERLKGTGREVTFRMTLRSGELMLNESDYTVDADDTITRYTSKKSRILVEVNGRWITIQSTARKT